MPSHRPSLVPACIAWGPRHLSIPRARSSTSLLPLPATACPDGGHTQRRIQREAGGQGRPQPGGALHSWCWMCAPKIFSQLVIIYRSRTAPEHFHYIAMASSPNHNEQSGVCFSPVSQLQYYGHDTGPVHNVGNGVTSSP